MSSIDVNRKIGTYTMGQNNVVESIWLKFFRSSHGKWIMGIKECIQLQEKLREYKPKHILELGTGIGCSTEMMAFACPNAGVYTIEQNQKCIDIAKTLISKKTQERIYFKFSRVSIMKPIFEINPFVNFMCYSTEYDWRDYDFILVDGPGPIMTQMKNSDTNETWKVLAEQPGGDIINLLPKMKEGTIIYIDGRVQMVSLYFRHLSAYLDLVERNKVFKDPTGGTWINYAIFRRNAEPSAEGLVDFKNSDTALGTLIRDKYFDEKI